MPRGPGLAILVPWCSMPPIQEYRTLTLMPNPRLASPGSPFSPFNPLVPGRPWAEQSGRVGWTPDGLCNASSSPCSSPQVQPRAALAWRLRPRSEASLCPWIPMGWQTKCTLSQVHMKTLVMHPGEGQEGQRSICSKASCALHPLVRPPDPHRPSGEADFSLVSRSPIRTLKRKMMS